MITGEITPQEAIIIREATRGLTNGEIAKKLYISSHTVKSHLQDLYHKTETHCRTEMCIKIMYEIFGNTLTPELILKKLGKKSS